MASSTPLQRAPEKDSAVSQSQPRKLKALERNNLTWESHRDEIRSIYVDQDKTLRETMLWFEMERGFRKSERKWKDKIKEWRFKKNIPAKELGFMVAKAEKRKLEEGKDTEFRRHGLLVDDSKVEQFKKRRITTVAADCIVPETPPHIAYDTPKPTVMDDFDDDPPLDEDIEHSVLTTFPIELSLSIICHGNDLRRYSRSYTYKKIL
ncbi:hypothetical protein BDZ45DRAFT_403561 [Acephala macrosclerotiorum]|nr:hypothetical protein BDZ45DRAFT_403561 [Acephala macrosclerotiorum]